MLLEKICVKDKAIAENKPSSAVIIGLPEIKKKINIIEAKK